jgi:hypothetical protein
MRAAKISTTDHPPRLRDLLAQLKAMFEQDQNERHVFRAIELCLSNTDAEGKHRPCPAPQWCLPVLRRWADGKELSKKRHNETLRMLEAAVVEICDAKRVSRDSTYRALYGEWPAEPEGQESEARRRESEARRRRGLVREGQLLLKQMSTLSQTGDAVADDLAKRHLATLTNVVTLLHGAPVNLLDALSDDDKREMALYTGEAQQEPLALVMFLLRRGFLANEGLQFLLALGFRIGASPEAPQVDLRWTIQCYLECQRRYPNGSDTAVLQPLQEALELLEEIVSAESNTP